jgi:truncated hemoglobin YjbI
MKTKTKTKTKTMTNTMTMTKTKVSAKTKMSAKSKSYPKMPTGEQTRARAASGDDGVMFDPSLWKLAATGNVLRKVAAAGEEGSAGSAASRADLVALLQAA